MTPAHLPMLPAGSDYLIVPVLVSLFFYSCYRLYNGLNATYIPSSLPWASESSVTGRFSRIRACIYEYADARKYVEYGYQRYSRRGLPFVLPRLTFKPVVVIPPSQLAWLNSQPDSVLGNWQELTEFLCMDLFFTTNTIVRLNPDYISNYHFATINQKLTRSLPNLIPAVAQELQDGLERRWGTDTENWTEVTYESITNIVLQTISRVFVGESLCRDEEYLKTTRGYIELASQLGPLAGILCPSALRPYVGQVICWPALQAGRKYDAMIMPLVKKRLADSRARIANPKSVSEPPFDFLQWLIDDAIAKEAKWQQTPEAICTRISMMNWVSVHTTGFASMDAITALSTGHHSTQWWEQIRQEASAALAKTAGKWTKPAVQELRGINSAVRESMRFLNTESLSYKRLVIAKEGLTLPSGEHLLKGTTVAVAAGGRYADADVYESPREYKPFRFCGEDTRKDTSVADGGLLKNQPFTQPSQDFLPFGYGKHSCPGRFFAAQEIKLLIALIAMNYDIRPYDELPERMNMSINSFPKLETTLYVRRRKD